MAQKKINIGLTFTANTQQAKAQMRELQNSINSLTNITTNKLSIGENISKDLNKANEAAIFLKTSLAQAFNTDTGRLKLGDFNEHLKISGRTIESLHKDLQSFGRDGERAFQQLARNISNGEMPAKRLNESLDKMWGTLKNTARWQISSSVLQGFTTKLNEAYSYAQKLNESLNNIRIVTGLSTEEMKDFSVQANKAAKALSTTTTAYTDAALIYFQQGLDTNEVVERANITIKMANAVGESSQTVSEWLTAVWNNFDDGSHTLEHYADVMTALGAATASSADEIADGLEKFSAVAGNVGLSYEYAASALATVTAQTRQSADIVGTAFKTLFTRINDLSLSNSPLDDGTTLGSYSQTLKDVGINIKTASGDLRDMDSILSDLGSRWKDLSRAEQQAVAQSVAGIRQANQLIALMDNWNFFQENLQTSLLSEGALEEQADIYADSWEAAQKRVQASSEAIYNKLLNDEFFIDLNNALASTLDFIDNIITSMGGLKGILPLIITSVTKLFGPKIVQGARDLYQNMGLGSKTAIENARQLQLAANASLKNSKNVEDQNSYQSGQISNLIFENQDKLTKTELEALQFLENQNAELREQLVELDKIKQAQEDELDRLQKKKVLLEETSSTLRATELEVEALQIGERQGRSAHYDEDRTFILNASDEDLTNWKNKTFDYDNKLSFERKEIDLYIAKIREANIEYEKAAKAKAELGEITENVEKAEKKLDETARKHTRTIKARNEAYKSTKEAIKDTAIKADFGNNIMKLTSGVSSLAFGLSSLVSIVDVWNNKDMTAGEKMLSIIMSLSMSLPMLIASFKSLKEAKTLDTIATGLNTVANKAKEKALERENHRQAMATTLTATANKVLKKNTQEKTKNAAAADKVEHELKEEAAARTANIATIATENGVNSATGEDGTKYTRSIRSVKRKDGSISQYVDFRKNGKLITHAEGSEIFGKESLNTKWAPKEGQKANIPQIPKGEATEVAKLGSSWKALGSAIGNFVQVFGPAVLMLAAAAAIGVTLYKAYTKHDKALKDATKTVKNVRTAYEQAVEASNKLNESVSKYKEGQDSLDKMVKGTLEYKQALLEANQQAMELIENNEGLKYSVIDGRIVIDENSLDQAIKDKLDQQQVEASKLANAKIAQNNAQAEYNRVEAARKMEVSDNKEELSWGTGVAAVGALVAAAVATIFSYGTAAAVTAPIIAAAVGALGGGVLGSTLLEGDSKTEKTAIDALTEAYKENQSIFDNKENFKHILELNGLTKEEIDALWANKEELEKVTSSNAALEIQNKALYTQLAQSYKDDPATQVGARAAIIERIDSSLSDEWKTFAKKIDDNDKQLQNAWKAFMDDGSTLIEMAGTNIKIQNEDGSTKSVTQKEATNMLVNTIREKVNTGTITIEEIKAVKGSGNGGFADALKDSGIDIEKIYKEMEAAMKVVAQQEKELASIGITNTDNVNNILGAITAGEKVNLGEIWSWEEYEAQLAEFNKNSSELSADVFFPLHKAFEQYEEDKINANRQASADFDLEKQEAEELQKHLTLAETDSTVFKEYVSNLKEIYGYTDEQAEAIAEQNLKIQNTVKTVTEAYKKNSVILKGVKKDTLEYATAIGEVKKSLEYMFDGLEVDTAFVEEVLPLLEKLSQGGEEAEAAMSELQDKISDKIVLDIGLDDRSEQNLLVQVDSIQKVLPNLEIGVTLSETELKDEIQNINSLIESGKITSEQAEALLSSQGFDVALKEGSALTNSGEKVQIIDLAKTLYSGRGKIDWEKLLGFDDLKRYHEIKEVLEDYAEVLGRIATAKDRAFGAEKLKYIEEERKLLEEELKAQEKYMEEIESYYAKDANKLLEASNLVQFDKQGRIINYTELQSDKELKELMDKYTETLNLRESAYTEYLNKQYALIDNQLERIDTKIENSLESTERELKYIDYQLNKLTDDAYDTAKAMELLGKKVNETQRQYDANQQGIIDLLNENSEKLNLDVEVNEGNVLDVLSKITESGTIANLDGKQVETLQKYYDTMLDSASTLQDLGKEVKENIISAFDAWNEKIETQIGLLEHQQKVLESYENIADLLGEHANITDEVMKSLRNSQLSASKAILESSKAEYENAQKMYKQIEESDIEDKDQLLLELEQKVNETQAAFLDSWANTLELSKENFKKEIDSIVEAFDEAVGKVEKISAEFERQKDLNDFYLKDYEKTYEINKLNRQINTSIDKSMAMSLRNKQKLNKLQEELLTYQAEGKEMSDYDLGYLQKKYELTLAQIALEEAQNAKSQVRLTRDSQGNYGYVYTADQNAVNNAQQSLEDKQYELEKYMDESVLGLTGTILQIQKEYQDAIKNLDENSEDYEEQLAKLTAYYTEKMQMVTGEAEEFMTRGMELSEQFNLKVATNFNETLIGQMGLDVTSFGKLGSDSITAMGKAMEAAKSAYEGYAGELSGIMEAAGSSLATFKNDVTKIIDGEDGKGGINEKIGTIKTAVQNLVTDCTGKDGKGGLFNTLVVNAEQILNSLDLTILDGKIEAFELKVQAAINKYNEMKKLEGTVTTPTSTDTPVTLTDTERALVSAALSQTLSSGYNSGGISIDDLTQEDFKAIRNSNYIQGMVQDVDEGKYGLSNPVNWNTGEQILGELSESTKVAIREEPQAQDEAPIKPEPITGGFIPIQEEYYLNDDNSPDAFLIGEENNKKKITFSNPLFVEGQSYVKEGSNFIQTSGLKMLEESRRPTADDIEQDYRLGISKVKGLGYFLSESIGSAYQDGSVIRHKLKKGTKYFAFDTGGYTGSWGPEGRLAMLHQKEIVLNAQDTENLLSAVQMIRSIVEKVELNAIAQRYTDLLSGLSSRVVQQIAPAGTLDQNVHIEAHFPNATDHSQIEEAFGNIVNLAAQYANRK